MATATIKIQVRRDTITNWITANPILLEGEIGYVISSPYPFIILGNGVDNFTTLATDGSTVFNNAFYMNSIVAAVQSNLDTEVLDRQTADTNLQTNITTEIFNRQSEDITLQNNINTEASNRDLADLTLQSNIDTEILDRQNADDTLQTNIDAKQDEIVATTVADYFRGDKTFQPLDKSAVGLSNVDNTSDANKPVSTAQQTALDLKQNSSLAPLRIKNRWHTPTELAFSLATGSLSLNNIYALAVRFTEPTTITDIGFIATSGVVGALANIGIYDSNSLGEPNNLVASASNINITSSGSKSVTLASPLVLPVGKYWFAIFSSATINVTSSGISSLAGIGNSTLVATTVTAILKGLVFTSLPNPFGAYTTTNQANVPFVWFKTS